MELVAQIIDGLFMSGYSLAGFKASMYKHYLFAMAEQGIETEDPYKSNSTAYLP